MLVPDNIDNILLQEDLGGSHANGALGREAHKPTSCCPFRKVGKIVQFASDCLYSWSTSIILDIWQESRAILGSRCDLGLMSKAVAGPGALLEREGPLAYVFAKTHRSWSCRSERLSPVHMPTADAEA